ncbi:hypothetical protein [Lyngbya aestuarii]|uniref:hypothetical protein n=1 Tax=Lyngbya aestuarii TaxID=118322 RepID=UPI00403D655A
MATTLSLVLFSRSQASTSTRNNLPPEIREYYINYNFVSSFSSDDERTIIANSLICEAKLANGNSFFSFEACSKIPQIDKSNRLDKIRSLIAEINQQILRNETNWKMMIFLDFLRGEKALFRQANSEIVSSQFNPYFLSSKLFEINQVYPSDKEIKIEVSKYSLNSAYTVQLISQYKAAENQEEKVAHSGALIESLVKTSIPTKEYHQWVLVDGDWRKLEQETVISSDDSSPK